MLLKDYIKANHKSQKEFAEWWGGNITPPMVSRWIKSGWSMHVEDDNREITYQLVGPKRSKRVKVNK